MLQKRQKWVRDKRDLHINEIVLVIDENMPRGKWPLGRIMNTIP